MNDLTPMGQGAAGMIAEGESIQQIKTSYHTAVAVHKPRNLLTIRKEVLSEMELGGQRNFYSWMVKDKHGNPKPVEGLSIGGTMVIARHYGNCAIETEYEETKDAYIFTSYFIDLQTGFTIPRIYKKTKTKAPGKYSKEQWADMEFNVGQSKCQRNVGKVGLPGWLQQESLEVAKQAAVKAIDDEGIVPASEKALSFLNGKGIDQETVELTIGKPVNKWTNQDIVILRGMCQQIVDGMERAEELFFKTAAKKHTEEVVKSQEERKAEVEEKIKATEEKPASDEQKGQKDYTAYREEAEAIAEYDKLQEWWTDNSAEVAFAVTPKSLTRFKNLIEKRLSILAKREGRVANVGGLHDEPEELTTKAPPPPLTLEERIAEFRALETVKACSQYLVRNETALREELNHEEYQEFLQVSDKHFFSKEKNVEGE